MRIVVPPATPSEIVLTAPGPQGPKGDASGTFYQEVSGGPWVEMQGKIFVGKDFPSDFPDGSIFFREV